MTSTAEPIPPFRPLGATEKVEISAADDACPAYLFKPPGDGPWPAVLFLMDGFGMRPTIMEMAQRLADGGYLVLLPDLFYRHGAYAPIDVRAIFATPDPLGTLREKIGASPSIPMVTADAESFLAFLRGQTDARPGKIGVTGYCMSGGMSLTVAGTYADQIGAAACFHGGVLVSDSETSPHLLAPSIKAEVYVGGAETDRWCPPLMVAQLDAALTAAGNPHQCEIYPGTLHGWTMRDSPFYDEGAAERHWCSLFALFDRTIR